MRQAVLVAAFFLTGCAGTATLNKKVDALGAKFRAENAALKSRVEQVEQANDALLSQAKVQVRITERLADMAKFLFNQDRRFHSELIILNLRITQLEKNTSDLKKKLARLKRKTR